jgi:hypothetical protein
MAMKFTGLAFSLNILSNLSIMNIKNITFLGLRLVYVKLLIVNLR